jgi:thiamine biosynthesis lipoprotein
VLRLQNNEVLTMGYIKPFAIIFILILTSCTFKANNKIQGFSMDAPYSVSSKGATKAEMQKAKKYLDDCDTIFSAYNDNSMLYKLNNDKIFQANLNDEYGQDLFNIIGIGKKNSNDVFDISIRPITKLWNFKDSDTIPNSDSIKENLKKVNYNNILFDYISTNDGDVPYIKLINDCEIELGAIAKGYVAEKIGTMLDDAIIDIGGTIKSTSKRNITVGLKSPDGDGIFATVELPPHTAISTSGSYERYFIVDNKLYHHILNPKTGYPVDSDIVSVSVIHSSGTMADILSTTFFAQGLEKAMSNLGDAECIFATKNNKVYLTKGVINFRLLNSKYELK